MAKMDVGKYIAENYMKNFRGNKYLLVNVASQRARQINDGVEVYVKTTSRHPLDVALEEIKAGFIDFEMGAPKEIEKVADYEDLITFEEMIGMEEGFDLESLDDEEAVDLEAYELDEEMLGMEEEDTVPLEEITDLEE
jgi:DNA-directed RNA polymerase omega subunit